MISDYILPLFYDKNDATFIGTAFCINNFLITAGHVVSDYRIYYTKSKNRFIEIYPDRWLIRQRPKPDHPENDIAICLFEGLKSPLVLSPETPIPDTEAEVICWQKNGSLIKQVITNSLIYNQPDQSVFYRVITIERITHGASGCPIIQKNNIIGILTMGTDKCIIDKEAYITAGATSEQIRSFQNVGENTCLFLPSNIIQTVLNKVAL